MSMSTCFLITLSNIAGAFSLVKTVTKGSLLENANSDIADLVKVPSATICSYSISSTRTLPNKSYEINQIVFTKMAQLLGLFLNHNNSRALSIGIYVEKCRNIRVHCLVEI